jgi:hypothetical protein
LGRDFTEKDFGEDLDQGKSSVLNGNLVSFKPELR